MREEHVRPVHVDSELLEPGGERRPALRQVEARVDYEAALRVLYDVGIELPERVVGQRYRYRVHVALDVLEHRSLSNSFFL